MQCVDHFLTMTSSFSTITSPRVHGVRPGHPFLFTVRTNAPGHREFGAEGLPDGLRIDPATGQISGYLTKPETFRVKVYADSDEGLLEAPLRIEVGENICLTPPMGWNSWNCWAESVTSERVLASAQAMVNTGLADYGWSFVNIDDSWQGKRDASRALQPNDKFPDLAGLCDDLHQMGFKAGIYSTPWHTSYAGFPGGASDYPDGRWNRIEGWDSTRRHAAYTFEEADSLQYAKWGFDFLKYDWFPNDVIHTERMVRALRNSGRDIIMSLSNAAPFASVRELSASAQCWRTTGDIVDEWSLGTPTPVGYKGITDIMAHHDAWNIFQRPGHWNDPDMLVLGKVGWGEDLHPTRLTPAQQRTHFSLWCLWSAPLLLGCPVDEIDPWTLSLLTNAEVLAINQDPLGEQAVCRWRGAMWTHTAWLKRLENGDYALGLINLSSVRATIEVPFEHLGLKGGWMVRDLWARENRDIFNGSYGVEIEPHDICLLRLSPESSL